MKIKMLSMNGVVEVDAEMLTLEEHHQILDHWEAVYRDLYEHGRPREAFTREWVEQRLDTVNRARYKLESGEIPYRES